MGGPIANAPAAVGPSYNNVPNNTKYHWIKDEGLRKNVFYCIGLPWDTFFNGYKDAKSPGSEYMTIDTWQTFFDHPTGNTLGLMNSATLFPGLG
ncbi:putative Major facilitator superfamily (MFS) profile domain-containing protein [Seiridium unicorne]|uniref:Major facilitator superfamily (MFS) profile domain-containing protein n=1 Tax=Seiridium unicorne TaxID=138068 RepID=A0ABR2V9P8_9PEZI